MVMRKDRSTSYVVGGIIGALTVAFLALAFEAWLLGLILSWFAVQLTFWQCFAIIFLVNAIMNAARSSK